MSASGGLRVDACTFIAIGMSDATTHLSKASASSSIS